MALDFPSNPVNNQIYGNFYWDSSMSAWRATGTSIPSVPSGVVSQYMGTTAPSGYLMCNGQSVLVADYPALYAVIGYNYGGSGANFTLPDMQGRVPVGKASSGTFNVSLTSAAIGGAETHTLTEAQLPSHTHTFSATTSSDGGHTHTTTDGQLSSNSGPWYAASGGVYNVRTASDVSKTSGTSGAHTHTVSGTTGSGSGSGAAHNNLQPYIVVNYIIKT